MYLYVNFAFLFSSSLFMFIFNFSRVRYNYVVKIVGINRRLCQHTWKVEQSTFYCHSELHGYPLSRHSGFLPLQSYGMILLLPVPMYRFITYGDNEIGEYGFRYLWSSYVTYSRESHCNASGSRKTHRRGI